jgi:tRNA-binding EMAP/Myf-like protein
MITTGVVVGRVVKVEDHPNAASIRLAFVDLGRGDPVQIVFGGPPVVVPDSFVAVAPPGSRLRPDGPKMRRRRYRGESSHGMLCSLAELNWDPAAPDEVALLCELPLGMSLDRLTPEEKWAIVLSPTRDPEHRIDLAHAARLIICRQALIRQMVQRHAPNMICERPSTRTMVESEEHPDRAPRPSRSRGGREVDGRIVIRRRNEAVRGASSGQQVVAHP